MFAAFEGLPEALCRCRDPEQRSPVPVLPPVRLSFLLRQVFPVPADGYPPAFAVSGSPSISAKAPVARRTVFSFVSPFRQEADVLAVIIAHQRGRNFLKILNFRRSGTQAAVPDRVRA